MIAPTEFARCFVETFDKSAVDIFRRWLATKPSTTKWIIAADFALRDRSRPGDCFAFSIIPYDRYPQEFAAEVRGALPRDLKDSKTLDEKATAWLRDSRHFHIVIPMRQDRVFYFNGPGEREIDVIRQGLDEMLAHVVSMERGEDTIRLFRATVQKAKANSFSIKVFTDLTLLSLYLALLTSLLCRERKPEMVSWFCDRDSMTNYCDGIVWTYAMESFVGICEMLGVDRSGVVPGVGLPDRSTGKEVMWFDHYIRAADWFAGALAAWDRQANLLPGESDKYLRMIEGVVADAENSVILPVHIDSSGLRVTRLGVSLAEPSPEHPPGMVDH